MRCRELPVIFLTSKDEEIDRVVGLELGADDYLCKPFYVRELVARVRALERRLRYTRSGDYARLVGVAAADGGGGGAEAHGGERYGPEGTAVRGVGSAAASAPGGARGDSGLRLDPDAIRVWWHGRLVPLTVTEFRLMEVLVRRHGAVLTREQLLRAAYPDDVYVTERSIDSHIRRIRKKFEETGTPLRALSAVYGAGYRYQEPLGE
jgi:two-component system response regulator ChvI